MPCHAKLAQIVECHKCHKTTGQIIMPVFYSVSPTVVKEGSPDYRKAVAGHKDLKTLQEWKEALIHLGSISEWSSNRLGIGTDASLIDQLVASLIDELVANVLRALNRYLVDKSTSSFYLSACRTTVRPQVACSTFVLSNEE